jgi:hypothetical protein
MSCLALVFLLVGCGENMDYAETVLYNHAEYVVCGEGEATILERCGLPVEISKDLAGEPIGYLVMEEKNKFVVTENESESQAELFEYAPMPNENVLILSIGDEYYAAIRKDGNGYLGLPE